MAPAYTLKIEGSYDNNQDCNTYKHDCGMHDFSFWLKKLAKNIEK